MKHDNIFFYVAALPEQLYNTKTYKIFNFLCRIRFIIAENGNYMPSVHCITSTNRDKLLESHILTIFC